MNKLKHICYAALGACLLFSCASEEMVHISGTIEQPGNVKVVSFYEGEQKLDSVYLGDGDTFKFERVSSGPRLLTMQVGNSSFPIILEPGKKIQFSTNLQDPTQYSVEGSELSQSLMEFAPAKLKIEAIEDSLQSVFTKIAMNRSSIEVENLRSEMLHKFEPYMKEYVRAAVQFAEAHPNLAGFYAMSRLDPDVAESELIAYADRVNAELKHNRSVKEFLDEVEKLKRLAIGKVAPDFESYTVNNKVVKLSDFRGKYLLLDFWASWCVPCREENPNIVRQYHAFKDKGFDILGVSLDDNPGPWTRAIKDDGLVWTNVSDLKAWSSDLIISYRIKAIPTSYLLDPEGKIVAKNLRGADLEEFLKKTLK